MVSIPNPSQLWDSVKGNVQGLIDQSVDALKSWIWDPLAEWLGSLVRFVFSVPNAVIAVESALIHLAGQFLQLVENLPAIVAELVISTFLLWVEAIGDLLDAYVDNHWDDPITPTGH